jgi:hypothetical protein
MQDVAGVNPGSSSFTLHKNLNGKQEDTLITAEPEENPSFPLP